MFWNFCHFTGSCFYKMFLMKKNVVNIYSLKWHTVNIYTQYLFSCVSFELKQKQLPENIKKVFLKILQNSQEKNCPRVSFLKLRASACKFIKEGTLGQVLPCKFYKISKNSFLKKAHPMTVSVQTTRILQMFSLKC